MVAYIFDCLTIVGLLYGFILNSFIIGDSITDNDKLRVKLLFIPVIFYLVSFILTIIYSSYISPLSLELDILTQSCGNKVLMQAFREASETFNDCKNYSIISFVLTIIPLILFVVQAISFLVAYRRQDKKNRAKFESPKVEIEKEKEKEKEVEPVLEGCPGVPIAIVPKQVNIELPEMTEKEKIKSDDKNNLDLDQE